MSYLHRSFDETTKEDVELARQIKELYFGNDKIGHTTLQRFIQLSGDHMFYGGTEFLVQKLKENGAPDIYRYMYSYPGRQTKFESQIISQASSINVCHIS